MQAEAIPFDPTRSFVEAAQAVLFFARLGERTVRCYVTRAALACYFGVPDDATPQSCLAAFDRWAEHIHRVARRCIGERGAAAQPVVITADDVFRAVVAPARAR